MSVPQQLGELPSVPARTVRPADFRYAATDQHQQWQVWVETTTRRPILELELEITYPPGVRQRSDFRGYMFRLALEWTTNEADRLNNVFTSELTQESGVLPANKHIQPLQLIVPLSMSDERDDV
jgi:hypothetical protein